MFGDERGAFDLFVTFGNEEINVSAAEVGGCHTESIQCVNILRNYVPDINLGLRNKTSRCFTVITVWEYNSSLINHMRLTENEAIAVAGAVSEYGDIEENLEHVQDARSTYTIPKTARTPDEASLSIDRSWILTLFGEKRPIAHPTGGVEISSVRTIRTRISKVLKLFGSEMRLSRPSAAQAEAILFFVLEHDRGTQELRARIHHAGIAIPEHCRIMYTVRPGDLFIVTDHPKIVDIAKMHLAAQKELSGDGNDAEDMRITLLEVARDSLPPDQIDTVQRDLGRFSVRTLQRHSHELYARRLCAMGLITRDNGDVLTNLGTQIFEEIHRGEYSRAKRIQFRKKRGLIRK